MKRALLAVSKRPGESGEHGAEIAASRMRILRADQAVAQGSDKIAHLTSALGSAV
ncbi:hypothetical protein [Bradyrhizobium sp. WSM1743]|uniref:hypothetical protein n=1 Tax=Bradyrhizobium sp. WSM1743 TaxID=318996 RepID=UPI00041CB0BA|nr:hypothetical protein [Bradyrhizobium sp. WSM1743]